MTTLEQIFNQCHDQIFNHALRVVKNIHDAEDIRSEVYVKIQRLQSARFDESKEATLSSWVHTVTNSVILDFFRTNHQDRYKAISDFVDSEGNDLFNFIAPENSRADSKVLTGELQERIVKAFHGLKFNYRRVATLYFIRGYEYNEIADMLNVPMGTVKGMLNRSRAMLQEALKGVYSLRAVKAEAEIQ